jgi:hypothetical protein
VFADKAEAGALAEVTFQNRAGIEVGTGPGTRTALLLDEGRQRPQRCAMSRLGFYHSTPWE